MRRKKRKRESHVKASSVRGIKTDKHAEGRTSGWQKYRAQTVGTEKVFVADTVRTEAECLKEKRTASKQTVTAISLLWNVK